MSNEHDNRSFQAVRISLLLLAKSLAQEKGYTSAYCFSARSSPMAMKLIRLLACSTAKVLADLIRYSVDNLLASGT